MYLTKIIVDYGENSAYQISIRYSDQYLAVIKDDLSTNPRRIPRGASIRIKRAGAREAIFTFGYLFEVSDFLFRSSAQTKLPVGIQLGHRLEDAIRQALRNIASIGVEFWEM